MADHAVVSHLADEAEAPPVRTPRPRRTRATKPEADDAADEAATPGYQPGRTWTDARGNKHIDA